MTASNNKIEICGESNRVNREKPRARKPYMAKIFWEYFCNDLDKAMAMKA